MGTTPDPECGCSSNPARNFPWTRKSPKADRRDESNLTGEATPVEKNVGDTALAGTINLWGAVEVVVARPAAESSLQKIITLIKEAQQRKAPAQQFTDKFSTSYTYFVIGLSFAMFFVWWLGFRLAPFASAVEEHSAFYRTMTLLVVSSPCALVLSIPSAVLAAIAWGARHGILFRGGAAVEKLADVNIVCLDKTGTLTTGELRVEKIESFPPGRENEIARLALFAGTAFHASARPRHHAPRQAAENRADGVRAFRIRHRPGLEGETEGVECRSADANGFERRVRRAGRADRASCSATDAGFSEVWIEAGDLLGRVILRDDIRPQSAAVVDELRGEGLRSVVLTGDRKAAAEHLRAELKLDDVRAELKPEQKVAAIQRIERAGKTRGDDRRRRERRAEPRRRAHRRGDGRARFGRRAGTGRRGADARPAGKFSRGVPVEPARAARHPAKSCHFARHGRGAGDICDAGQNSADDRRGRPRRQHGRGGDEQFAVAVWRGIGK